MASGGRPGTPPSWPRPDASADEVLDDERAPLRLPRWARRAVVAVVLLAVLGLAGPRLLSDGKGSHQPREAAATPTTAGTPVPSFTPTLPGSLRWATRGDLAADRALLDSVRARLTGNELTSVEEILWAGRVRGGRAVLAAGFDQRTGIDPAFSVPVIGVLLPDGGHPTTVQVGDMSGGPDTVLAWALPGGQALLVGPPTDLNAQVSPDVTFTSDGRAHRSWVDASGRDGWSLTAVSTRPHASIAVRTELGAYAVSPDTSVDVSELPVAGTSGPAYRGPTPALLRETISQELPHPPLAGWGVTARVVWSAHVGEGGVGQAVVVVLRRSDGAVFRAGMIGGLDEGPAAFGLRTVRWTHPEQQPYVFGELGGSIGLQGRQVVAVPGGAGTLSYVSPRGQGVVRIDAQGVALVPVALFDIDPVQVTVRNSLGTRQYDRQALFGDDPQGAGFEDRIGGPG